MRALPGLFMIETKTAPSWYERNKERAKAKARAWYIANKQKAKAARAKYHKANKAAIMQRNRAWKIARRLANPNYKPRNSHAKKYNLNARAAKYSHSIKSRYNLSWPEFTKLYEDQHGVCGLCSTRLNVEFGMNSKVLNFTVDHCHSTGQVRGLLCRKCNTAIGMFGDSKDMMIKAIAYLEKPPFNKGE